MKIELLENLVEATKKNKKGLRSLKDTAVICQQYELAANLRDIEREAFPETEDEIAAKKLSSVLGMVGLEVSPEISWLVNETLKVYGKKKGNFALSDAVELKGKAKILFSQE